MALHLFFSEIQKGYATPHHWRMSLFESQFVTLAKLIKRYADEFVGVEKEILFLSFDFDEPESLIGEAGDCSCLHSNVVDLG